MMRHAVAVVVLAVLLAIGIGSAHADDPEPATRISQDLADLGAAPFAAAVVPGTFVRAPLTVSGDHVTIDAVAAGDPAILEADLIALGATNTAVAGRMVSARIPIAAIPL